MRIVYSFEASVDLDEIFAYNKRTYGFDHAIDYVLFLQDQIDALSGEAVVGKPIDGFAGRLALTIRRSLRGHGHVAVYRVEGDTIRILHVFHTAQDIQRRMERE